jgi:hypothetical protein
MALRQEANVSISQSVWSVVVFRTAEMVEAHSNIRGGDVVRFIHVENDAVLSTETELTDYASASGESPTVSAASATGGLGSKGAAAAAGNKQKAQIFLQGRQKDSKKRASSSWGLWLVEKADGLGPTQFASDEGVQ